MGHTNTNPTAKLGRNRKIKKVTSRSREEPWRGHTGHMDKTKEPRCRDLTRCFLTIWSKEQKNGTRYERSYKRENEFGSLRKKQQKGLTLPETKPCPHSPKGQTDV